MTFISLDEVEYALWNVWKTQGSLRKQRSPPTPAAGGFPWCLVRSGADAASPQGSSLVLHFSSHLMHFLF